MLHFNTVISTLYFHNRIIQIVQQLNIILVSVLEGSHCVTVVYSLTYNGRHIHSYWHIYDLCCDGCKCMNCSLPQLSHKSWSVWRPPKSNIHKPDCNNFYSVLLNQPFTSHKSPVLSVFILLFYCGRKQESIIQLTIYLSGNSSFLNKNVVI